MDKTSAIAALVVLIQVNGVVQADTYYKFDDITLCSFMIICDRCSDDDIKVIEALIREKEAKDGRRKISVKE